MASGRSITELPEELLNEIFSYITAIPEKISLEQVSHRFKSIASQSKSWKGIHKLEMMIMCREEGYYTGSLKGICTDGVFLNGIGVPFAKWPAAIQLLLERTTIKQVIFHYGDSEVVKSNPNLMASLLETFQKNQRKLKLRFLEFHFHSQIASFHPQELIVNQLHSIFSQLLQISTLHLQEFALRVERGTGDPVEKKGCFPEIWPIIQKCKSLKTISFDCPELSVDLKSFIGKPLTKLAIYRASNALDFAQKNIDLDSLLEIMNSRKNDIQSIIVVGLNLAPNDPLAFRYFCDNITEKAKVKFNFKLIRVKLPETNFFNLMFSMLLYANAIETSSIEMKPDITMGIDVTRLCEMAVSVFAVAFAESSSCCKLKIVELFFLQSDWKIKLLHACQVAAINVQFGQPPNQIKLTKGRAAIVIGKVSDPTLWNLVI